MVSLFPKGIGLGCGTLSQMAGLYGGHKWGFSLLISTCWHWDDDSKEGKWNGHVAAKTGWYKRFLRLAVFVFMGLWCQWNLLIFGQFIPGWKNSIFITIGWSPPWILKFCFFRWQVPPEVWRLSTSWKSKVISCSWNIFAIFFPKPWRIHVMYGIFTYLRVP